jgi:inosine-uridine nucleoside N-ribohydrolase
MSILKLPITPRARLIIDNDFGGDPDGLFQVAHHLLSPSVEVRGIIASKHYPTGFYGHPGTPEHSREELDALLNVLKIEGKIPVFKGAARALEPGLRPQDGDAARFIVEEAMRTDAQTPLFVVCGAGLGDLASACLIEPEIAQRITLVWIGGPEYPDHAYPPPNASHIEYNLGIDLVAAQVIFNSTAVPLWQVPRNAYRQTLVSMAEIENRLGREGSGRLSWHLRERLCDLMRRAEGKLGEAYALGDNPLVLLTALQSSWEADPSSSSYTRLPCPRITDDGQYAANPDGRQIRVYHQLDTRLILEDMFAKFRLFDAAHTG